MRPVNLFLIGAAKSGSTTLHEYLAEHPEIFMSPEKEPGFFVKKIWGDRSESEYEELFRNVKDEIYIGESSTYYAKLPTFPGVAEKIHQYNSAAKILYVVRHPIERAISQYFHNRRSLHSCAESRPILKAFREDISYIAYSDYAMQIEPYLNLFGKDNVFILVFESFISDPQPELSKIFEWLDIEKFLKISLNKMSNVAPEHFNVVRGFGLLNRLRYSNLWRDLSPYTPKIIKTIGSRLSERKEEKKIDEKEKKIIYQNFIPICRKYVQRLENLTGRSYSLWNL
jgi:hypothetical protein